MTNNTTMSGLEKVLTGIAVIGALALGGTIAHYDSLDAHREIERQAETRGVPVKQIYKEQREQENGMEYIDLLPMLLD